MAKRTAGKRKGAKPPAKARRKARGRQAATGGIESRAALARAMGVSGATITRLLARDDCPLGVAGPWGSRDVAKLRAYRETLQEDRAAAMHAGQGRSEDEAAGVPAGTRAKVEVQLKMEKLKKLRRERQVLEGEYIAREDVVAGWASRARYFKATLYGMLRGVSPRVAAQDDPAACEKMLLKAADVLLEGYTRSPLPGVDDPAA